MKLSENSFDKKICSLFIEKNSFSRGCKKSWIQKFYIIPRLGSFFFRLPFFWGSHSAAVFEDINKRFFATNRKMNNLELGRDGFFDFDLWLKIFWLCRYCNHIIREFEIWITWCDFLNLCLLLYFEHFITIKKFWITR